MLIVDDNLINLQIAAEILKNEGCNVRSVSSGQAALDISKKTLFDLILMDIQMPDMDGVMTTRQIKEKTINANTPIIAMTAYSILCDKEKFLNAGMDDFIAKPIEPQEILKSVKMWTKEPEVPLRIFKSKSKAEDKRVINPYTIEKLIKYGGEDLVNESLNQYDKECTRQLAECQQLGSMQRFAEILVILHTLKGNAGTLGVEKMAYWAEFMEGELKIAPAWIKLEALGKLGYNHTKL